MSDKGSNIDFISLGLTTAGDDELQNIGYIYQSMFITKYDDDSDDEIDGDDDGEPESSDNTALAIFTSAELKYHDITSDRWCDRSSPIPHDHVDPIAATLDLLTSEEDEYDENSSVILSDDLSNRSSSIAQDNLDETATVLSENAAQFNTEDQSTISNRNDRKRKRSQSIDDDNDESISSNNYTPRKRSTRESPTADFSNNQVRFSPTPEGYFADDEAEDSACSSE